MPRVHHVKRARKPNPVVTGWDIRRARKKKDDSAAYYHWSFRYGGKRYSKKYPRASQLTQSKMGEFYSAQEEIEDIEVTAATAPDVPGMLESAVENARAVSEEYNSSADSMEDAFPGGCPTMDECREKAEGIESWCDEVEGYASEAQDMASEIENWDEKADNDGTLKEKLEELRAKVEDAMGADPGV